MASSLKKRNAFEVLMSASTTSPPSKKPAKSNTVAHVISSFDPRNGLSEYLRNPENPRVLGYNEDFVTIRDLYPKATVHLLILPREQAKQFQQASEAFKDDKFFTKLTAEAAKWRALAAKELARTLCPPTLSVPERDWEAEINVGIHSVPSMNHLHIHVISRDMHSPCVRHKKHYNSFTTPFFVKLEEFPLSDEEAAARRKNWHKGDMICWRCGKNFENKFSALKQHLEKEFDEWKSELIEPAVD